MSDVGKRVGNNTSNVIEVVGSLLADISAVNAGDLLGTRDGALLTVGVVLGLYVVGGEGAPVINPSNPRFSIADAFTNSFERSVTKTESPITNAKTDRRTQYLTIVICGCCDFLYMQKRL